MKTTDEQLLETYWKGWKDCSDNIDNKTNYKGIEKDAYELGWINYIVGDDVTSVDSWTDEQILAHIKKSQ